MWKYLKTDERYDICQGFLLHRERKNIWKLNVIQLCVWVRAFDLFIEWAILSGVCVQKTVKEMEGFWDWMIYNELYRMASYCQTLLRCRWGEGWSVKKIVRVQYGEYTRISHCYIMNYGDIWTECSVFNNNQKQLSFNYRGGGVVGFDGCVTTLKLSQILWFSHIW